MARYINDVREKFDRYDGGGGGYPMAASGGSTGTSQTQQNEVVIQGFPRPPLEEMINYLEVVSSIFRSIECFRYPL